MIRCMILQLICTFALCAQLRVLATPEPMEVVRALNVRDIGLWDVVICNDGDTARSVPVERIRLMLPGLRIIDQARAQAVVSTALKRSKRALAARLLTYGAALATTFTGSGLVTANARVISSLAVGTVTLTQTSKWVESSLPDLSPFAASSLSAPVELQAGACTTRTVFAAKTKGARPIEAREPAPLKVARGEARFEFAGLTFAELGRAD